MFTPVYAGEHRVSEVSLLLATGGKDHLIKMWNFSVIVGTTGNRLDNVRHITHHNT